MWQFLEWLWVHHWQCLEAIVPPPSRPKSRAGSRRPESPSLGHSTYDSCVNSPPRPMPYLTSRSRTPMCNAQIGTLKVKAAVINSLSKSNSSGSYRGCWPAIQLSYCCWRLNKLDCFRDSGGNTERTLTHHLKLSKYVTLSTDAIFVKSLCSQNRLRGNRNLSLDEREVSARVSEHCSTYYGFYSSLSLAKT